MRFLTLIAVYAVTAIGLAQDNGNGRDLLEEVASAGRSARSWRAEGVTVADMTINGVQHHEEIRFMIAVQGPSRMHWETSGADHTLMVCDGTEHWAYYGPGSGFFRSPVAVSPCNAQVGDYVEVTKGLLSATVIGQDHVRFAGALRECRLVRAEYQYDVQASRGFTSVPRSVHTLCIDPELRMILRDRLESAAKDQTDASGLGITETTTYLSYERDVTLPRDTFHFVVPTGTIQDEGPKLPNDVVAEAGIYRIGPGVSIPRIASKIEASFTEEARQARISGISLVSIVVDSSGKPQNIKVVRGLGHGLDEKAIEAVRQWRFHPGTKDGVPAAVGPLTVVVNFQPSLSDSP